ACFGCTDPDALNYDPDATIDDGSCDYLIPGDLNHDGLVNVTDVVEFVGIVLFGTTPTDYQLLVGDLYQPLDGQLTILDLVILVELAIGPSMTADQSITTARLMVTDTSVLLETDGTPAGIQLEVSGTFDLLPQTVPPGWSIYSSENRVILLSLDGSTLAGKELFEFAGDLIVTSATIVDWDYHAIQPTVALAPERFSLEPAFPNPFNPVTTITYQLPENSRVIIRVYDVNGKQVAELTNRVAEAGNHSLTWDAGDLPSGLYFVKMTSGSFSSSQKVMLMK
ncbi:MAG: T9SS type A sorting domain-containing protein, partial [FCB group bacterium]|nr:T9SS type A sorting domain-containing protein [FCB group bacterium]